MEETAGMEERVALAEERIHELAADPELDGGAGEYFQRTARFVEMILETGRRIRAGELLTASLDSLKDWNRQLFGDLIGEAYEKSFANPDYAVERLGEGYGQILSFVYAELRGMIAYVFEGQEEEMLIREELFLLLHGEFARGELPDAEQLRKDVYWFISDYSDVTAARRIREQVDPSLSFARDIIMTADLSDPRYLYRFGEYISETELQTSAFLQTLPREEIDRIASVYTEGYRLGFAATGKDLSIKRTVNIRYCLGFERIIRRAVENFSAMGLESILYRAAVSRINMRENQKIGYYGASPNRQYEYDHKGDAALFLDRAFLERKLGVVRTTFERYRELAKVHAGPAVMEIFGETPFEPKGRESALKLDGKQQQIQVELNSRAGQLTNTYIPGEERSFTIIAFPIPEIGERFEEIFRETVKINTLDYRTWQRIQQRLIDALDQGERVRITGAGANRTSLEVALQPLKDPSLETNFENCVADVNIPVGEVFTTPRLAGTDGLLHVTGVYLNGLYYRDLTIAFRDGMVRDYTCGNYEDEEENRRYIRENILYHHETLPMGEFAIGTNTTAYVMARRYGIEGRLPILIAEKTGPHFAVGDTCYSWEEDTATYNPDGKRIAARENDWSALRREDPQKAYFNCHTDITLPYDELGEITVIRADQSEIRILQDGRFVLEGTQELNGPLEAFSGSVLDKRVQGQ